MLGKGPMLLLAVGAALVMAACTPMAQPSATTGPGGSGGETPRTPPPPPEEPAPASEPEPQDTEKRWTISAAHFRDDGVSLLGDLSNRSEPFAWDRITAGNVRVSIGGNPLPFTSTAYQPAFASDIYGAEYTVAADVRAGAVVLVLTAPDQSGGADRVASVTITAGGTGYTSAPTVTFQAAPPGGETAAGAAVIRGMVSSVAVSTAGTGYTSAPTISFTGGGGAGAAASAALGTGDSVASVTIDTAGSGYTVVPAVTFGAAPSGGATAAGTAVRQSGVASVTVVSGGSGYTSVPPFG